MPRREGSLVKGDGITAREQLVEALADMSGDDEPGTPRSRALVDALDTYLAENEGERTAPLFYRIAWAPEDMITERDTAIARAEKAEQELNELRLKYAAATAPQADPKREDA